MTYLRGEVPRTIPDFPTYEVTNYGRVINKETGREMVLSPTYAGDLTVGMVKYGCQFRRSVKVLVAEAFVIGRTDIFNTPIQIDGNRRNLYASNIVWRPRWFAWEYTHQFNDIPQWAVSLPILDVGNNIEYACILEAAVATASLCKHIYAALASGTHVFPGGERYVYI